MNILEPSAFVSKITNKTLNTEVQELTSLIIDIPKQLKAGVSEEQILETIEQAKTAQLSILIAQCIAQTVMKGSQRKTLQFFLTVQFISYSMFYEVSLPTVPALVVEEM